MPSATPEVRHRRRGPQLEAAVLTAAWDELVEAGYASLTMESVAQRAQTGIAVLYRRWPNKEALVLAAIEQFGRDHPIEAPDTGSLRGDLIALLTSFSKARSGFIAIAMGATFSGFLTTTGLTPAQARERLIGDELPRRDQLIYRRAHERGEIDLDRIPPAVLAMPMDLVRHDLVMNLTALKPARIRTIVDDLFLPLVLGRQGG